MRERQVTVARVQRNRLVADEVVDGDGVLDGVDESAVAAVGDRPDRAADRRRAVAALGAELAVGAGMQQLQSLACTPAATALPFLVVQLA